MDTVTKNVVVRIDVKKPTTKGFAALGEAARTADRDITARLGSIQKKLQEASTVRGLGREMAADFFGISRADRQLSRFATSFEDNLRKFQRKAVKLPIDGDPGPLFATLRRLQADATRVQRSVRELSSASLHGFSRAGTGALGVAQGAILWGQQSNVLAGGSENLEKALANVLKFQATLEIFRGSREVISGTVGGMVNLGKSIEGLGTASKLSNSLTSATAVLNTSLAATAKASGKAAAAEVALTRARVKGGGSALEVAGIAGAGAASVAGTGALAGIGKALLGLGALGTGLGAGYMIDTYVGNPIRWFAGMTPWGRKITGDREPTWKRGELKKFIDNAWDVTYGTGAQQLERSENLWDRTKNFRDLTITRAEAIGHFEDRKQQMLYGGGMRLLDMRLDKRGLERFREDRAVSDQHERYGETLEKTTRPWAGAAETKRAVDDARRVTELMVGGSKGTMASEEAKAKAALEHIQTTAERDRLLGRIEEKERRIRDLGKEATKDQAELEVLTIRYDDAQQRVKQTAEKLLQTTRQHGQAERERLNNVRQFASETEKFFRGRVDQNQDRRRSLEEAWGAMSPVDRMKTLQGLDILNRGPGKGRPPRWFFDAREGRMKLDPGTATNLNPEMRKGFVGNPFFQFVPPEFDRKAAQADLGGFNRGLKGGGFLKREQRDQQALGQVQQIKANVERVENKFEINLQMDVDALSLKVSTEMHKAIASLEARMMVELKRTLDGLRANGKAVQGR